MDSNYHDILSKSLRGERAIDEKTYSSLEILRERLRRLKRLGVEFEGIDLSPEVKRLARNRDRLSVC